MIITLPPRIAASRLTPPMAPVVLVLDGHLQEEPVPREAPLRVPKLTVPVPPQGEDGAVEEVARLATSTVPSSAIILRSEPVEAAWQAPARGG